MLDFCGIIAMQPESERIPSRSTTLWSSSSAPFSAFAESRGSKIFHSFLSNTVCRLFTWRGGKASHEEIKKSTHVHVMRDAGQCFRVFGKLVFTRERGGSVEIQRGGLD